ncbi:right-handed parallel beta-helix repeat-containing protein [Catellatospora vulcania]|uniref:right-handed parallel beta-helix repeat-containing protein n=1 Tax=Catellatospora vulcania TaxID=1460450 RepID=UPI0012D3DAB2|nr:right-handed parallel beta-helix repeat-containing protein [Catellatospora vulcania]
MSRKVLIPLVVGVVVAAVALAWPGEDEPASAPPRLTAVGDIAGRGASLPWQAYEAEHVSTDGTVIGPDRRHGTLAGEASGRMAVTLQPGQRLTVTLAAPANAVNVRFSIPDSADGRGQDSSLVLEAAGATLPPLALTSRYSWFYGGFPFTNNPAQGGERHLYDSARTLLGTDLPAGATVTLRAGRVTTLDLVEFEQVEAPLPRPAGALSVADFGADPGGAKPAGEAFTKAIEAARAQRKVLFVPEGRYAVGQHLLLDGVTVQGAGLWHTELRGKGVGVYGNPAPKPSRQVRVTDLAIIGEVDERDDHAALAGVGGALGGGSVLERLWIQHVKVGMWLDGPFDGLRITGCRILDVTADGINLHQGVSNTVISGNLVRNTGDDGIALWSEAGADGFDGEFGADRDVTIERNTVQLPMLANGIAMYGGHDNTVRENVVADIQVEGGGIHVGNRFSATLLRGTTRIERNTTLRAGADHPFLATPIGALWFYAKDAPLTGDVRVTDNDLLDSTYAALQVFGSSVTDVTVTGLRVHRTGTHLLQIQSAGSLTLTGLTADGVAASPLFHCPDAVTFTLTGTSLTPAYCGPFL